MTGAAVLAKHRAKAPRYVARDSNVTSREDSGGWKERSGGRVGKDSGELMVSRIVTATF